MLAVVLCLRGRSAKLAADFLQSKKCRTFIALGPVDTLFAIEELNKKRISRVMIVTDSEVCLKSVQADHDRIKTVYWGEGAADLGRGLATFCLAEQADLIELSRALESLDRGLPPGPDPGIPSRLRRI
jgi:hypothetical protein